MAGKKDRRRKLARERYQRRVAQQGQQAQWERRARKWIFGVLAIFAVAGIAVGGILFASRSNAAKPSAIAKPPSEPAHHCIYTPKPPAARNVGFPPTTPDYKAGYQATIATNRGDIVIDLLNSKATCTVNSFIYLAAKKYFNSTYCHRLTSSGIYVLQCGDPTETGRGGPGYKFEDENLPGAKYSAGTVAMVNTGPNTNGSQFFLAYKNSSLEASYTPFGKIINGLGIIREVAEAGSDSSNGPGDGHPKEKVEIERVTIKKTLSK